MTRRIFITIFSLALTIACHAQSSAEFTITRVLPDKLLYDTGDTVNVAVTVSNPSATPQQGEIRTRLEWEMDEGVQTDKTWFVKNGRTPIGPLTKTIATKSWQHQVTLSGLYDPANPDQEWKVYWSIRLTGPNFPFGKVWERDAILVDRMILVKCVPGETLPNTLTAAQTK
jgi:hypothetical protein